MGHAARVLIRATSRARGVIFTAASRVARRPRGLLAELHPSGEARVSAAEASRSGAFASSATTSSILGRTAPHRSPSSPRSAFAVFTFDDAYHDNLKYALPVLRKNQCPFTLYVPTALVDGMGEVWWQALEDIIAQQSAIAVTEGGENDYLPPRRLPKTHATYETLYAKIRACPRRSTASRHSRSRGQV